MNVQRITRRALCRARLPAAVFLLLSAAMLCGCLQGKQAVPDAADRRFAAFYSDYLVGSGVTSRNEEVVLAPPTGSELERMLARHSMKPEEFQKQVRLYREQPERWKNVLVLIRSEVRKKSR
ncbi:MAG: hypothetical protein FJZ79_04335 [Chlorobi bacterium]|nr:hypothetical protein [Chlorobiota bacterium]